MLKYKIAMKMVYVCILQLLIVKSYAFSHNIYKMQLDLDLDALPLQSADSSNRYSVPASMLNNTINSTASHNNIYTKKLVNDQQLGKSKKLTFQKDEVNETGNDYKHNIELNDPEINSADENDDSKSDFEHQLAKFFIYPIIRDDITEKDDIEEATNSNNEDTSVKGDIAVEILSPKINRTKRELTSGVHYEFNIRPADDANEGESTTLKANLTSISEQEMEEFVASEPINNSTDSNAPDYDSSATDANTTMLAQLANFLLSFYATLRDLAISIYTMIGNMFN